MQQRKVALLGYGAIDQEIIQSCRLMPLGPQILLLSPIVGDFESEETRTTFSPPKPAKLKKMAQAGRFPAPKHCAIHLGENDWQSIPANVGSFGQLTGIPVWLPVVRMNSRTVAFF